MKTSSASPDNIGQDDLDTLLAHAPRYAPPAGFADRVLARLHDEEETPWQTAPLPRPWYLRPYAWGSAAAAACLAATLCLLPLLNSPGELAADTLAVDDALLVEEALDAIDDPDLVTAICSVAAGY